MNTKIETKILKVKDIKPNPKNPKKHCVEKISESMSENGYVEPIVVDENNMLLAGHGRQEALKEKNVEEIEVVVKRGLTAEQKEKYMLLSNKLSEAGGWDMEMLKDFDINLLMDAGFNDQDLSEIWDNTLEINDDDFDEKKELEKAKETKIKQGDFFQLGGHFLICGNSHRPETLNRLLGSKKVSFIYNDPIYNIGVSYDKGIGGKAKYGGIVDDSKNDAEYREFLKQGLKNSLEHANKNCHVFTWCDQSYIWLIQTLYQELGIKNERVCFWFKNGFNPTPNVAFNKAVEHCVYGTIGRPFLSNLSTKTCEAFNKEISTGNRAIDDMLDILEIWMAKRDPVSEYNHSTQKPLTLHEKPLMRCSKPGDAVLDIYGGAGSTLLSCHQLKRICYTAEINPIFCQLIINRFESYANIKSRKIN